MMMTMMVVVMVMMMMMTMIFDDICFYKLFIKTFHDLAMQTMPYYMKSGDTHEGYIVDLMQKVKEKTNLTFQFSVVADGKFGSQDADGSWNGMVGEVVEGVGVLAMFLFRQ